MADTKISALTANATPAFEDLLTTIDDPGGTPASRKTTIEELLTASVAAANTSLFSPTGYSLTGSDASPAIDIAGTWNTTGAPSALKLNITDTASDAASLLLDLQVGGVSKFNVRKDGAIRISNSLGNGQYITFDTNNRLMFHTTASLNFGNGELILAGSSKRLSFGNAATVSDSGVERVEANNISFRSAYGGQDLSADPSDPAAGRHTIWQSDGTASGDDGDIMLKITDSLGTTKTITLVDFSAF